MPQEKVKIIVEVSGGVVTTVYAGNFVECIIIDHDNKEVARQQVASFGNFDRKDVENYTGDNHLKGWGV